MLNPSANHFSSKYPYSKKKGGLVFFEKKGGKCFSNGRHFDLVPQKKISTKKLKIRKNKIPLLRVIPQKKNSAKKKKFRKKKYSAF